MIEAEKLEALMLKLSTAYNFARDQGFSEVDCWKNVALVAKREMERMDKQPRPTSSKEKPS